VVAQDVTFLGGAGGDGGSGGGSGASYQGTPSSGGSDSSKPAPGKKQDDVVIEDIGDEPINLDDIPF